VIIERIAADDHAYLELCGIESEDDFATLERMQADGWRYIDAWCWESRPNPTGQADPEVRESDPPTYPIDLRWGRTRDRWLAGVPAFGLSVGERADSPAEAVRKCRERLDRTIESYRRRGKSLPHPDWRGQPLEVYGRISYEELTVFGPRGAPRGPRPTGSAYRRRGRAEYSLVPHQTENGRGYVIERVSDGQRLRWLTIPLESGLFAFDLVGESRRVAELQDPSFGAGCEISFEREPDNPHDPSAVSAWNADRSLQAGYIPADTATLVVRLTREWDATAYVMWESFDGGSRRVALRVILIAAAAGVEWR
jgi:hypothetical protein